MAAIELKPQVDEELSHYASGHGLSKAEVLHTALLEYLEDREDYDAALHVLRKKTGVTPSLEEVRTELAWTIRFRPVRFGSSGGSTGNGKRGSPAI